MNEDLVELYLDLLEGVKYSTDGAPYDDPTADAAVVRTEIREWLEKSTMPIIDRY